MWARFTYDLTIFIIQSLCDCTIIANSIYFIPLLSIKLLGSWDIVLLKQFSEYIFIQFFLLAKSQNKFNLYKLSVRYCHHTCFICLQSQTRGKWKKKNSFLLVLLKISCSSSYGTKSFKCKHFKIWKLIKVFNKILKKVGVNVKSNSESAVFA